MRNFKAGARCVLFLSLMAALLSLGDFLFMPSGYARFILHEFNDGGKEYDCIVLGGSHARNAVNPYILDEKIEKKSFNLSIPSETIEDSYYLLKYVDRNQEIETVLLEIDFQYWYKLQKNEFKDGFIAYQMEPSPVKIEYILRCMAKKDFRASLCSWTAYIDRYQGVGEKVALKRSKAYKDYDISAVTNMQANGPYQGRGWFDIVPSGHNGKGKMRRYTWDEASMCEDTVEIFKKMVNYCKKNDIELICFTSPIAPAAAYANEVVKFSEEFTALAKEAGVIYYDFNLIKKEILALKNEEFGDWDGHMTGGTSNRFTQVLGEVLKSGEEGEDGARWFYKNYGELFNQYDKVLYVEPCLSWYKNQEKYYVDLEVDTVYNPKYGSAEFKVLIYQDEALITQTAFSPTLKYRFELPRGTYLIRVDARMKGSEQAAEEYGEHVLELTPSMEKGSL